jgi:hypothetical protein
MEAEMERSTAKWLTIHLIVTLLAVAGCSDDDDPGDSVTDTGVDAAQDAAQDVAQDTTDDVAQDVAEDVARDTAEDVAQDATADAGDTGQDTSQDTGQDTEQDTTATAEADTCATAIDATAGGTWGNQSTSDATDDYDSPVTASNCPSGAVSGKDEVYSLSPAATTTYEVTVTPVGSTFDPFLYVRTDCSQDACLAGTVFNGPGQSETVTFDVQGGQTAFVIVDGELGTEGDYALTVAIQ